MKLAWNAVLVLVTAPNLDTSRALAKAALEARLVACANGIPKIESHYWWQGKIESADEVLIIFKTTKAKLKALEKLIVANHPYDTPEFLVLPIIKGNKRYLDWVSENVSMTPQPKAALREEAPSTKLKAPKNTQTPTTQQVAEPRAQ